MAFENNEKSWPKKAGAFLLKRLISALMTFIMIVTVVGVFLSPADHINKTGNLWLNGDYKGELSLHDEARIEGLIQNGVIHTREQYVSSITGFYSTIISTLIAFVGFFAILQFTFIINQAKEASKKALVEHLEDVWPDLERSLEERAREETSSYMAEEYEGRLNDLDLKIVDMEKEISSLEAALREYTDDPEPPEEGECEEEINLNENEGEDNR